MKTARKPVLEKEEQRNNARDHIFNAVRSVSGCKATELAAMSEIAIILSEFGMGILEEMVAAGDLIEIEYELEAVPGRLKSFFLPGRKATCYVAVKPNGFSTTLVSRGRRHERQ